MPGSQDDNQVIDRVLGGDRNAFALLLKRHQAHVAKVVAAHVPGNQVEEVAHEAFVRAYTSLAGYRPIKPFRNWLTTIAMRCCHDFWRAHYRRKESPVCDLSDEGQRFLEQALAPGSRESFDSLVRQLEAREILDSVLCRLAPMDRLVLTLTFLEGHTAREAAEMLDISTANVKVRSFRARKKLKNFLKRHGIQGGLHAS